MVIAASKSYRDHALLPLPMKFEVLQLLLTHGADANVMDQVQKQCSTISCYIHASFFITTCLLFQLGRTALWWATKNKNSSMVSVLLKRGANPNLNGAVSKHHIH